MSLAYKLTCAGCKTQTNLGINIIEGARIIVKCPKCGSPQDFLIPTAVKAPVAEDVFSRIMKDG